MRVVRLNLPDKRGITVNMQDIKVNFPEGSRIITIVQHAETCPHCSVDVSPILITTTIINQYRVDLVYQCPRSQCKRTYIGSFYGANKVNYILSSVFPNPPIEKKVFPPIINETSPSFTEIYNQAYEAEQLSLSHISGMGYRKALEFLIKDYVIMTRPDSVDVVMNHRTTLNKVIREYINDPRIVQTAERAAWIGNDETHYVRKWEDKDISDLKILIDLVSHWISMEILTEIYFESMN
ncbi:hypothetical protein ACI2LM_33020 [Paenibacillus lautus]|uniref:hypothetical protein n=1 Tax=Paenibacillus lautus TaxID=1401 RepID=UPI00384FD7A1